MEYKPGAVLPGGWKIVRVIGKGSFGQVFEVQKESLGSRPVVSALKWIRIPASEEDLRGAYSDGMDERSASRYFRQVKAEIEREIGIMAELKDHPGIVRCEDFDVIEYPGEVHWDVLIRMELLTPLIDYAHAREGLTLAEILRLGIQTGDALVHCHRRQLLHLDVKPENIFIDRLDHFKLGDFGIARSMEKTTTGLTPVGTVSYMAPEIYHGTKHYDRTVDIYSLGLVLYRYLNHNRMPFMPSGEISPGDHSAANMRRMTGEPIPPIPDVDEELNAILLRACAYNAADRYRSADELSDALRNYASAHNIDWEANRTAADAARDFGSDADSGKSYEPYPGSTSSELSGSVHGSDSRPATDAANGSDDKSANLSGYNSANRSGSGYNSAHAADAGSGSAYGSGNQARPDAASDSGSNSAHPSSGYVHGAAQSGASGEGSGSDHNGTSGGTASGTPDNPGSGRRGMSLGVKLVILIAALLLILGALLLSVFRSVPDSGELIAADITPTPVVAETPTLTPVVVTDTATPTPTSTPTPTLEPVYSFREPAIEHAVREALDKSDGDIYPSELATIESLDLSGKGITDISDLSTMTGLTDLRLGNAIDPQTGSIITNEISDISPLAGLTSLTRLNLSFNHIRSIDSLSELTNLTALDLSSNAIMDVEALARMMKLTVLDLSYNAITNVTPLTVLNDLTRLDLSNNNITDVSALSRLTQLTLLDLSHNSIRDLSPLSSLTALEELYLSQNSISDFSPLENLPKLTVLEAYDNYAAAPAALTNVHVKESAYSFHEPAIEAAVRKELHKPKGDIYPSELTSIGSLDLSDKDISDISDLSRMTKLRSLDLSSNTISDLSPLSGLTNLTDLNLIINYVTDLSPLSGLTRLTDLDLSGTGSLEGVTISDLSPLSGLTNLTSLFISSCDISDLSPLSELTELESLVLTSCNISDVSPLSSLTKLWILDLSYNMISDVSPLSKLTNLESLYLSDNEISDVSPLSSLTKLWILDLSNNMISDVSPLSSLTNLERLYLYDNEISDLSPLSSLTNLESLYLYDNKISDVSPLSSLTKLKKLDLRNNPISDRSPVAGLKARIIWR